MGDPNDPASDNTRTSPPPGLDPGKVQNPSASNPTLPDAPREGPGGTIGRYKLLQVMGEGGFGVVHLAEQEYPVRRRVALKVIKLGMDTRLVTARFEAERQALALMDHPNIAKVLDAGATDAGRPYFVMELVKGVPITQYCDENRLGVRQRLELFAQVCRAVQHAHQKGIIHRDIKPSNVLVAVADGQPTPKVIDFGIAKALNQRLTDKTLFTEFRQFLGTPEYMSPEQAGLSGLDVDTRSDVYSLGVLLYELLTGTTPFDPKELRSKAYAEIERIIREVEPPPPSTRLGTLGGGLADVAARRRTDPRRLSRMLHGELDWIVMRCLEKDRTRRYDTANGLAMDVERYLRGEAVSAGPPSVLYRLGKSVRRHRVGVAAGCVVVAALAAGAVAAAVGRARAIAAQAGETRQRTLAEVARDEAEEVTRYVEGILRAADPDEGGRADMTIRDALAQFARSVDQGGLGDRPGVEARVRLALARTYSALGQPADAERHARRALEIRRHQSGEHHPDVADCLVVLAAAVLDTGDVDRAERDLRRALATYRDVRGDRDPRVAATLVHLAHVLYVRRELGGAEAAFREAIRLEAALSSSKLADRAASLDGLGLVLCGKGQPDEAEQWHQAALAARRKVFGDDHPTVAISLNNIGLCRVVRGDPDGGKVMFKQAIETMRRLRSNDHPHVAAVLQNLASVHYGQGDYDGAASLFREAIEVRRRTLPPGSTLLTDNWTNLIYALQGKGDPIAVEQERARLREWLRGAPREREDAAGGQPPAHELSARRRAASAGWSRGRAYSVAGDHTTALDYYQKAIALLRESTQVAPEDVSLQLDLAVAHYLAAGTLIDRGDVAAAFPECHLGNCAAAAAAPAPAQEAPMRETLYNVQNNVAKALERLASGTDLPVDRRTELLREAHDVSAAAALVVTQMEKSNTLPPSQAEEPRKALDLVASSATAIAELKKPAGPFHGKPASLPGTVQAEDFDAGGFGVAYHDTNLAEGGSARGKYRATCVEIDICRDEVGGHSVGGILPGEWLSYSVDVTDDGLYDLDLRITSAGGGSRLHIEIDGQDVTGPIVLPRTGDWFAWQTTTRNGVSLRRGRQVMRIVFDAAQTAPGTGAGYVGNLNWVRFRPADAPTAQ